MNNDWMKGLNNYRDSIPGYDVFLGLGTLTATQQQQVRWVNAARILDL